MEPMGGMDVCVCCSLGKVVDIFVGGRKKTRKGLLGERRLGGRGRGVGRGGQRECGSVMTH